MNKSLVTTRQPSIVSFNNAGMANRIKNIVSCIRLSDNVQVKWKPELHAAYGLTDTRLTDYFVGLDETDDIEGKEVRKTWKFALLEEDNIPMFLVRESEYAYQYLTGEKLGAPSSDGRGIDLVYDRIPEKVRQEYLKCFDKLEVSPEILEIVDDIETEHFDGDVVSVHIRSWKDSPYRRNAFFDLNSYRLLMDEYGKDKKFYVSADDPAVVNALINHYGTERILSINNSTHKLSCMIDMLLLSKNDVIIGSPYSSFTEVAWWFSKCKSEVVLSWK